MNWTNVCTAVAKGHREAVKALLSTNDPDLLYATNRRGMTCLSIAIAEKVDMEIFHLLMDSAAKDMFALSILSRDNSNREPHRRADEFFSGAKNSSST